jgi:hypothetical protein
MIIQFQSLTFKNLLSYGATPTTTNFSSGINLISGQNGQGKCVYRKTKINVKMSEKMYKDFINMYGENKRGK